jgi:hypothetical protein
MENIFSLLKDLTWAQMHLLNERKTFRNLGFSLYFNKKILEEIIKEHKEYLQQKKKEGLASPLAEEEIENAQLLLKRIAKIENEWPLMKKIVETFEKVDFMKRLEEVLPREILEEWCKETIKIKREE